jgi:hypothetical protein
MHLANYLQYSANLLSSKLEVQPLVYVDLRMPWIYHPNLFSGILDYSKILPLMSRNYPHEKYS